MADFSKFGFANGLYKGHVIRTTAVRLTAESLQVETGCCLVSANYFEKNLKFPTYNLTNPIKISGISYIWFMFIAKVKF